MKKTRHGFTVFEVILFLSLTAMVLIGVFVGTSNSINQQRYHDSVENFAEFLRRLYSKVADVQGFGDGRSEQAIYGKLITFGETLNFNHQDNKDERFFVYDVVGDLENKSTSNNVTNVLYDLKAAVVIKDGSDYKPAGIPESYLPNWSAIIETTSDAKNEKDRRFKGTLLIVRSPLSGTIYTYILDEVIEVNKSIKDGNPIPLDLLKKHLDPLSTDKHFEARDINFCINFKDIVLRGGRLRHNIRITANAHGASDVENISVDDHSASGNQCLPI